MCGAGTCMIVIYFVSIYNPISPPQDSNPETQQFIILISPTGKEPVISFIYSKKIGIKDSCTPFLLGYLATTCWFEGLENGGVCLLCSEANDTFP